MDAATSWPLSLSRLTLAQARGHLAGVLTVIDCLHESCRSYLVGGHVSWSGSSRISNTIRPQQVVMCRIPWCVMLFQVLLDIRQMAGQAEVVQYDCGENGL